MSITPLPRPSGSRSADDTPSRIHNTDDLRIREIKELAPPGGVIREIPGFGRAADTVFGARNAIPRILYGGDDRLFILVGPFSIHDPKAAREYASRLASLREEL